MEVLQIFFLPRADWGDVKGARTRYSRTQKASAELLSTCPPWSCGGSHSGSLPAPLVSLLPPRFCLPLPTSHPGSPPLPLPRLRAGRYPLLGRGRGSLWMLSALSWPPSPVSEEISGLLTPCSPLQLPTCSSLSPAHSPSPSIQQLPSYQAAPSPCTRLPFRQRSAVAPRVWPESRSDLVAGAGKDGAPGSVRP